MNLHRSLLVASLVAAAGLSIVPMSAAQAAESLGGNAVPGVCLLSREAVFAQSKVGQAASQRLGQLAQQARTQLDNQRKPLDTDLKSFQQKAESLSEAQRKQQGEALQKRVQTYQGQAGELNQRIQLTRTKAMQRIGQDAEPLVASTYKSHHCGLLLDRDSVLGGNMTNDLTPDVIKGLDGKVTTISFNLEPLPSNSGK
ncbi:OmpH family outer membrane protein [Frateuria hangzhouensis]|uniref:OmpH family outer membrane protein n=1 Tax=Frateuria hangzhouensis TaxID=2995589 RepID=UPI002260F9CC|nr:OmpH family outer membrane protein [Frateuria sp. STR12]MCX7514652.1 OmpH family outer membrane protein [Frateuria sp. STR12]